MDIWNAYNFYIFMFNYYFQIITHTYTSMIIHIQKKGSRNVMSHWADLLKFFHCVEIFFYNIERSANEKIFYSLLEQIFDLSMLGDKSLTCRFWYHSWGGVHKSYSIVSMNVTTYFIVIKMLYNINPILQYYDKKC